jgi:DNA helicase-2/ATP-dependent DNA helicase PcrA
VHGMAEMYVGTIHAYCLDLLTAEVPKYLKFDVLNEVQQALFIDRHSNKSGLTASTDLAGQPLKRYRDTSHYLSAIGILREADISSHYRKLTHLPQQVLLTTFSLDRRSAVRVLVSYPA